ncbi:hypothetical protein TURU_092324 [Turdus rufiventris]|nr:hypothetical protein TURU_092324 [Turdus rufiventris]
MDQRKNLKHQSIDPKVGRCPRWKRFHVLGQGRAEAELPNPLGGPSVPLAQVTQGYLGGLSLALGTSLLQSYKGEQRAGRWDFGEEFLEFLAVRGWDGIPRFAGAAPGSLAVSKTRLGQSRTMGGVPAMAGVALMGFKVLST